MTLALDRARTGWVGATLTGPVGAHVRLAEAVAGVYVPVREAVLDGAGRAVLPAVVSWRCDRTLRTLAAFSDRADGGLDRAQTTIRTPGCADRLRVRVGPAHPRAGRALTVEVADRWGLGDLRPRACAQGPGRLRTCRVVALAPQRLRTAVRLRVRRPGHWRVGLTAPGLRRRNTEVTVRHAGGRLTLLATGDSMIQILDDFIARGVRGRGVDVRRESHISTGISKPFLLDWVAHARGQARGLHPDVSVVFLGANDGFPIAGAQCCGEGWIRGYAQRVGTMMRAYARGGAGVVYWLLLPAPARESFKPVYRAVNEAARRAAAANPVAARIVDLARIFTPGGVFRPSMRWGGRVRSVRQGDGIHLNTEGASIAATIVVRALRRDGVI